MGSACSFNPMFFELIVANLQESTDLHCIIYINPAFGTLLELTFAVATSPKLTFLLEAPVPVFFRLNAKN